MIKPVKGDKYYKKNFYSLQIEPHTAKLCFSVVLKHFGGNSQRTSRFSQKSDYLRKEHWNTQKVCFSEHVWKGANSEENMDLFKQLFLIKPVKGDKYLQKPVFLLKVSHIQLNYAFLLFWSIFVEIQRTSLFYQKSGYLRKVNWNTQKVCFS